MTDLDLDAIEARRRDVVNVADAIALMPGSITRNPNTIAVLGTRAAASSADVPALVAALREARAALLDPDGDLAWQIASAHDAKVTDEFMAEGGKACCNAHGYKRERDDLRRRYDALRDAVLGLCDEPEPSKSDWRQFIYDGRPGVLTDGQHAEYNRAWLRERIQTIRAVVARVEES